MGACLPPGSCMVRIFRNVSQRRSLKKGFRMHCYAFIMYLKDMTTPESCYCLNQASLTRNKGRAGEFPVGKTNRSQTATDVVVK